MRVNMYFSATLAASMLFALPAMAVQLSAKDVSNEVITCDKSNPFLSSLPDATCIVNPPSTLLVTAKLDDGEDQSTIDQMYVVMSAEGKLFVYDNTNGYATSHWKDASFLQNEDGVSTNAGASFNHMQPFDGASMTRQVSYGEFSGTKGATLYVGVRSAKSPFFSPGSVAVVFKVK